jgi:hypothetical protein
MDKLVSIRVYRWDGFSDGIEKPEVDLGKLTASIETDKLIIKSINGIPVNVIMSDATLYEFYPDFTGYEIEDPLKLL